MSSELVYTGVGVAAPLACPELPDVCAAAPAELLAGCLSAGVSGLVTTTPPCGELELLVDRASPELLSPAANSGLLAD